MSLSVTVPLEPYSDSRMLALAGPLDRNFTQISQRLHVNISASGGRLTLEGEEDATAAGARVLRRLYELTLSADGSVVDLDDDDVHLAVIECAAGEDIPEHNDGFHLRRGLIRPRTRGQARYIATLRRNAVTFGIGPAGTGKTYLAVAAAVEALERTQVRRIVLTRPAVEAGERLGFLPGTLAQKVDPYLRPLYDALFEMLGFDKVERLIERQIIEIAPLAYMRGRTLNDAFIILDESQNTTIEQMKMFLTRLGFNSRAVVTGDPSQTDLPRHVTSGLSHALKVLEGLEGIGTVSLSARDVVRHPVVAAIVDAYAAYEKRTGDAHEKRPGAGLTTREGAQAVIADPLTGTRRAGEKSAPGEALRQAHSPAPGGRTPDAAAPQGAQP